MRVVAAIVLVAFTASLGCSGHRWTTTRPEPEPRDADAWTENVAQSVRVTRNAPVPEVPVYYYGSDVGRRVFIAVTLVALIVAVIWLGVAMRDF